MVYLPSGRRQGTSWTGHQSPVGLTQTRANLHANIYFSNVAFTFTTDQHDCFKKSCETESCLISIQFSYLSSFTTCVISRRFKQKGIEFNPRPFSYSPNQAQCHCQDDSLTCLPHAVINALFSVAYAILHSHEIRVPLGS